ncbi:MAG TPA: DUF362 domain-containing protein [Candidatus Wunengus sp. YC64]
MEDIHFPYNPDIQYPEYRLHSLSDNNYIYRAIRDIFYSSDLDKENYGTERWNPLGAFIQQGDTVLIKPNLLLHRKKNNTYEYFSVVTHPAIIRCVVDYIYIALEGKGKIIIGDAPINSAYFSVLCDNLGLSQLVKMYAMKDFCIELLDFRLYTMEKDSHGIIHNKRCVYDIGNHIEVKIDKESSLTELDYRFNRFRVTEYDGSTMPMNHCVDKHRYFFHKAVLDADVIISLPKIKTHRKAGFTCAMKNYVGLNGYKDWLPHHTQGSIEERGDEYLHKSFRKKLISRSWDVRWKLSSPLLQSFFLLFEEIILNTARLLPFRDTYFEGSWYGNKTLSRTINDLNRAVIYCDKKGELQNAPQRRLLYLVDGVICGEGEGPMEATPKRCNVLLWGYNSFAIDMVVAKIMGFDHKKIDTLQVCRNIMNHKIFDGDYSNIKIMNNVDKTTHTLSEIRNIIGFSFKPSSGWQGHVELE